MLTEALQRIERRSPKMTERREQLLLVLLGHLRAKKRPPSHFEIAEALQIAKGSVRKLLQGLETCGMIEIAVASARGITVTERGYRHGGQAKLWRRTSESEGESSVEVRVYRMTPENELVREAG